MTIRQHFCQADSPGRFATCQNYRTEGHTCRVPGGLPLLKAGPNIQICTNHVLSGVEAIQVPNGGSARGYLGVAGPLSSPGMAYWMVACSVYLYIAIFGVNVRSRGWFAIPPLASWPRTATRQPRLARYG